ncbi:MAG: hypothetical protein ACRDRT_14825, partial [Pseudonocardiaceae bacterium]
MGNDSATALVGALCLFAVARLAQGVTIRRAVGVGAASAAAILTKGSGVAILPLVAIGLLGFSYHHRLSIAVLIKTVTVAGSIVLLALTPWIIFNEAMYGATSGGAALSRLVVPIIGVSPTGFGGVLHLIHTTLYTMFSAEALTGAEAHYRWLWAVVVVSAVAGGLVASLLRARRRETWTQLWLAGSFLLGLLTVAVTVVSQDGAGAALLGRHVNVLLPELFVAVAYGSAALLTAIGGSVALAGVLGVASFVEIPGLLQLPDQYTVGVIGRMAPVIEQSYSNVGVMVDGLVVLPPCPVSYV